MRAPRSSGSSPRIAPGSRELTAQPDPTFASLVVPVEELSYRLSRVWSPIGHLNAVANSAAMREAYNECVPLLTAYSSELGQNDGAACRRTRACCGPRAPASIPRSARWSRTRCAISASPASICPPDSKARYREVVQRLAHLATKFSENVLDAARAYIRAASPTSPSSRACRRTRSIAPPQTRARRASRAGCSSSISRPT